MLNKNHTERKNLKIQTPKIFIKGLWKREEPMELNRNNLSKTGHHMSLRNNPVRIHINDIAK